MTYVSKEALIDWLMPYAHMGEMVDPEQLIEDINRVESVDTFQTEEILEFAESVIRQFAYKIKINGHCAFTAGGLSTLEEAFCIVGWDDPKMAPESECEAEGCHEWATCGMPTPDGYKFLCSKHRKMYQKNAEAGDAEGLSGQKK